MVDAPVVLDASATTTVLVVCHFPFFAPEFLDVDIIMILRKDFVSSPIFSSNLRPMFALMAEEVVYSKCT